MFLVCVLALEAALDFVPAFVAAAGLEFVIVIVLVRAPVSTTRMMIPLMIWAVQAVESYGNP